MLSSNDDISLDLKRLEKIIGKGITYLACKSRLRNVLPEYQVRSPFMSGVVSGISGMY